MTLGSEDGCHGRFAHLYRGIAPVEHPEKICSGSRLLARLEHAALVIEEDPERAGDPRLLERLRKEPLHEPIVDAA